MAQAERDDWHTHDRHGVPVHTHAHPHGDREHSHAGWTLVASMDEPPHFEFKGIRAIDEVTPLSVLHAAAVAGPGHVEDVPVSASEPNPPKAGRHRLTTGR